MAAGVIMGIGAEGVFLCGKIVFLACFGWVAEDFSRAPALRSSNNRRLFGLHAWTVGATTPATHGYETGRRGDILGAGTHIIWHWAPLCGILGASYASHWVLARIEREEERDGLETYQVLSCLRGVLLVGLYLRQNLLFSSGSLFCFSSLRACTLSVHMCRGWIAREGAASWLGWLYTAVLCRISRERMGCYVRLDHAFGTLRLREYIHEDDARW